MSVTPVEVEPTVVAAPLSVYKDKNLTVYGIPVAAAPENTLSPVSPEATELAQTLDLLTSNKRKRSPSPSSPSKRSNVGNASLSTHSATGSLEKRMRRPGFSPTDLTGEDAQQWRKLAVLGMFRQDTPSAEPNRSKSKGKNKQPSPPPSIISPLPTIAPDSEARVVPNRFNLPHRDRQLPPFAHGRDSSKETLCYVCTGPRNRGKFDVEKAESLGLKPGPLRAKIAKGQTVTVTVDDGTGAMIERVIRPEDCIGPTEASMVWAFAQFSVYGCSTRYAGRDDLRHPHSRPYTFANLSVRRISLL